MTTTTLSVFAQLKSGHRLPSPKGVVLKLIELSQKEDASVQQVTRLVQSDPALAGRIMRAANGVGSAPARPVIACGDAILRLGMPAVFQLALGFSLVAGYRGGSCKAFDYDAYWSRSLLHGLAARSLARRAGLVAPDEAFACGLLGRVGRLGLATAWPDRYGEVMAEGTDESALACRERTAFAISSGELTRAMLCDWGFPPPLLHAIAAHEQPGVPDEQLTRPEALGRLLHVAGALADLALCDEERRGREIGALWMRAARCGFDAEALEPVADEVLRDWLTWSPVFDLAQAGPSFDGLSRSVDAPRGRDGLRILCIESDDLLACQLAAALSDSGHEISRAMDARGALALLVAHTFDCVLVEWSEDGRELCRMLRATRPGRALQLVALGFEHGEEAAAVALEEGADDYLAKPFSPRLLEARLKAAARVARAQTELHEDLEELRRHTREIAAQNRRLMSSHK